MLRSERARRVVALYREKRDLRAVGVAVGLSHEWVRQILLREGEPLQAWGTGGRYATFDRGGAALMYQAGASLDEVGRAFGVSPTCISHVLRERGIARRRTGPRPKNFASDFAGRTETSDDVRSGDAQVNKACPALGDAGTTGVDARGPAHRENDERPIHEEDQTKAQYGRAEAEHGRD